jgi:cation diffusion facilitator CzcD-associated flavoprotein CzcO
VGEPLGLFAFSFQCMSNLQTVLIALLIFFQWPIFTPSGKLANWLETYADVLELNVWCGSTLLPSETDFDQKTHKWNVTIVRGDGSKRKFTVGHVVLATGLGGGYPKMPPPFDGQETFTGRIVHSSEHGSGAEWKGKKALVVGSCTSAHDVSLEFLCYFIPSCGILDFS